MHDITTIEIIPVGPDGDLFQLCDGELYAHLEMEGIDMPWDDVLERVVLHPQVLAYIGHWVSHNGVLIGSQHPPRLYWKDIARDVPAARLL
jgi:hypothetical protein